MNQPLPLQPLAVPAPSNYSSLDSQFRSTLIHAVAALEEAFARYGQPEITNTDQGGQFTVTAFADAVLDRSIKLSKDGKGYWRDNVFVDRGWRSVN